MSTIDIAAKKTKLASLEARLDKIIGPELRAQLEPEDLSKALKG